MNIPGIPIELIIAVLFFVLPALGSLQKRLRERRQRETSAERAPTPTQPATTLTRADTTTPATRGQTEDWLEEAQRRVREARQEEAAKGGRGGVNPRTLPQTPTPAPVPRPAARPAPKPARPPQPSRPTATHNPRPSLEGRSLETTRSENASLETPSGPLVSSTAPPLRVQRLGGGGHATIARELRFDERALVTGFIWSQVLSPPVSKRRTRLSRRQP